MGAFQDKIKLHIQTVAKKHKLDADFEMNYSNTGEVYFRKGFKNCGSISFNFQNSYCGAKFKTPSKDVAREFHYVEYSKNSDVQQFISFINSFGLRCSEIAKQK